MGLPAIGKSAFGVFRVRGQRRFAYPPARTIAYRGVTLCFAGYFEFEPGLVEFFDGVFGFLVEGHLGEDFGGDCDYVCACGCCFGDVFGFAYAADDDFGGGVALGDYAFAVLDDFDRVAACVADAAEEDACIRCAR